MNMVHGQHVHPNDMYLSVDIFLYPAQCLMCIQCRFMHNAVWRFSNNISSTFRCKKVALNREIFLHYIRYKHRFLLANWAGIWRGGLSIFLSVCMSVSMFIHLNVYQYIHTSFRTSVCLPVCLYICQCIFASVIPSLHPWDHLFSSHNCS